MTDQKPTGRQLGRGLSALLGEDTGKIPQSAPQREAGTAPVEFLKPSPLQPRRVFAEEEIASLANSVREQGILQPILVRPDRERPGHFEIVAGERRWRAAQAAQLHEVPVIVRELDDESVLEIALVENVQRTDLNPLEEAHGYRRLIDDFGHTQDKLARVIGKSRSHIANTLRLLSLPESLHRHIQTGGLTAGHARALIGTDDPAGLADQVVEKGLNVRQTESLVKRRKSWAGPGFYPPHKEKDPDTSSLERTLSEILGLKVTIDFRGEDVGGHLSIRYRTLDQLDDVIRRLGKMPE